MFYLSRKFIYRKQLNILQAHTQNNPNLALRVFHVSFNHKIDYFRKISNPGFLNKASEDLIFFNLVLFSKKKARL